MVDFKRTFSCPQVNGAEKCVTVLGIHSSLAVTPHQEVANRQALRTVCSGDNDHQLVPTQAFPLGATRFWLAQMLPYGVPLPRRFHLDQS